jgi:choice-of-anchor B domain-containing protein
LAEIFSKSFAIYDVSDIENPRLIKRVRDSAAPSISFHNVWTTVDGRYLLTTEETQGRHVRIWDLADERNPVEVSKWIGAGGLPHNVHVKGDYAHIAHYGGGYRVVDLKDPRNPTEVAYFNNKAGSPTGFVGVWEVYPYFTSGKVVMSSMEDGLFVTRFTP